MILLSIRGSKQLENFPLLLSIIKQVYRCTKSSFTVEDPQLLFLEHGEEQELLFYLRGGTKARIDIASFYLLISEAVVAYFQQWREKGLLYHKLQREYGLTGKRLQQVFYLTEYYLNKEDADFTIAGRFHSLQQMLWNILMEHHHLDFNGLFRFRLQQYEHELERMIGLAEEEWMLYEEYRHVPALMQLLLPYPTQKHQLLHLLHHRDAWVTFYDETYGILQLPSAVPWERWKMERGLQGEEWVSTLLLALAPTQVVVHSRNWRHPFVQQVHHLFQQRFQLCIGCRFCRHLGKKVQKFN